MKIIAILTLAALFAAFPLTALRYNMDIYICETCSIKMVKRITILMSKVIKILVFLFFIILNNSLFAQTFKEEYNLIKNESWWLPDYYEILKSKNRDLLIQKFPIVEEQYFRIDDHAQEYVCYTWMDLPYTFEISFSDNFNDYHVEYGSEKPYINFIIGDRKFDIYSINNIKIDENLILFYVIKTRELISDPLINIIETKIGDEYIFTLKIDGDYVDFYIDDKFVHTFCRKNVNTEKEYDNLITTGTCDLSKVTWPHHADGTSEYEDTIVIPKPVFTVVKEVEKEDVKTVEVPEETEQVSKPKKREIPYIEKTVVVKKKTIMTVSELLVLTWDPAEDSTQVVSIAPGTKVKILKVGKKATLYGRTSNWVYVNFPEGGKNKWGEDLHPKTEGWCFGGYLE